MDRKNVCEIEEAATQHLVDPSDNSIPIVTDEYTPPAIIGNVFSDLERIKARIDTCEEKAKYSLAAAKRAYDTRVGFWRSTTRALEELQKAAKKSPGHTKRPGGL